jgi:DNA-binding PadR family transcriptional regulator
MRTRPAVASGLEHALLGLLHERPMHAYEMDRQLRQTEQLGLVWHLKQGHLYALLARLEAAGYLVSTAEAQGTRPPRKMLHLTPHAEADFAEWMAMPVEHGRDFRQEFLAKLYFASREGPAAVDELVTRQRQACLGWLEELQTRSAAVDAGRHFELLVLRFRAGQIEAILRWLEECAGVFVASPR